MQHPVIKKFGSLDIVLQKKAAHLDEQRTCCCRLCQALRLQPQNAGHSCGSLLLKLVYLCCEKLAVECVVRIRFLRFGQCWEGCLWRSSFAGRRSSGSLLGLAVL